MTQRRGFSESPAMRSSEAATGIPSRMRASSISTTTGPTTRTTTSASADPRNINLDAGTPDGRQTLGRGSPGAAAPKARQHAQPETAALPTGGAVECGKMQKLWGAQNATRRSEEITLGVRISGNTPCGGNKWNASDCIYVSNGWENSTHRIGGSCDQNCRESSSNVRQDSGSKKSAALNFRDLTTLDNLWDCWQHARSNKGSRLRIQRFAEDPLRHLITIQQRLRERRYTFGPYKTFTVREKKFRDVVDAPMKDRIVHWMLYQYMLPIWQPRFIHDTFGNLPGRGTHAAINRLAQFARSERAEWVLQLDISKYFYSVNHALLKERVLRYIGDHDLRMLMISLIDSFRTDDSYDHLFDESTLYRQTSEKGMPIGNLTSQLFANIFLNDFDHWVKETLRVKRYVRYVDDMAILGESHEELQAIREQITAKLASEGLTIHPHKIRIAPTRAGIPFLGSIVWPNHISAGRYIRSRYHQRLRQHESGTRDRTDALQSYRAMFAHTRSTR